ncbi:MAG: hypothetical protein ABEI86_01100, partial [Halobacteriaceae archaeon]
MALIWTLILSGNADLQNPYMITLLWTMSILMTSIIGIAWKLEYVEDELGASGVIGVLLCVGGAE